MTATKALYATRDFKDEGTGAAFALGDEVKAEAGSLENYRLAGLASEEKPKSSDAKATDSGKSA